MHCKCKALAVAILLIVILFAPLKEGLASQENKAIVVGSKRFTENYIVAEIFAQLLESHGHQVKRKFGMGGTMVAFKALENAEIDLYPDYTGTIAKAILKMDERDFKRLNQKLSSNEAQMLDPLGFENTYATIVTAELAEERNLKNISDLSNHPDLVGAFSFEFQERNDGWPGLKKVYNLSNSVRGLDIPLTYEALRSGKVDFAEAYSTEPLILKYGFIVLKDDKNFFPKYYAVGLLRKDLSEIIVDQLSVLSGKIDDGTIIKMNAQAVNGVPIPEIANTFLISGGFVGNTNRKIYRRGILWEKIFERTRTHIYLTLLAVFLATIVAVPLATFIAPYKKLSQVVLGFAGILQTIPSIALLTFMIPFFGIGFKPAIIGLFVYSLLPILRNTHVAMTTIDPRLITAARGIGLYPQEVLFSVKLPLAFPTILTGIRTATILNIGTATLAAFIGAGGLGEPIVTGLALNDTSQVLQGAIPAALLAILMDGYFSLVHQFFVKKI